MLAWETEKDTTNGEKEKMLKKELQQKIIEIRERIKPLKKRIAKLGNEYLIACKEERNAHEVSYIWQYSKAYCESSDPELIKKSQDLRTNNIKEWHKQYYDALNIETEKEFSLQCARQNYLNFLNYYASVVLEELKPLAKEIYNCKGDRFHQAAEILNDKSLKWSCEEINISFNFGHLFSDSFSLDIHVFASGGCGLDANKYAYYNLISENTKHEVKKPKILTVEQFKKALEKINLMKEKFISLQRGIIKETFRFGVADSIKVYSYPKEENAR